MTRPWFGRAAVWFWIILAAAVALRVHRLASWDMWTDEMNTLQTSASGDYVSGPMYRTAPLNFLATSAALRLLGPNELGARAVPFVAGVLTVLLVYPAFRRRIGPRAALFAMAVVALSVWHLYWSQTARHFSLQTLLILGAIAGFLSYWDDDRVLGLAASCACTLAAMFTHSSGGFYLAALMTFVGGSWAVQRFRMGWRAGWSAGDRKHGVALAALVLVFVVYLPIYVTVGVYTLEHRTAWNPPWNIVGSLTFYIPTYLALPALAGAAFLSKERNGLGALLLCLVAVPVTLVTLASVFTIASGAYCLASLLAVAALVGVACDRLLALSSDRWVVVATSFVVAAVFCGLAYDCALYETFYNGLKPRWKQACAFVGEHRAPGDLVLADEGDVAQFYLGRSGVEWFGRFADVIGREGFPPADTRGVWYIIYFTDSPILRKNRGTLHYILDRGRFRASFPLHYGPKDRTLMVFYQPPEAG